MSAEAKFIEPTLLHPITGLVYRSLCRALTAFCYARIALRRAGYPGVARKTHCEIFRDGERFGDRVRFYDLDHFHYISSSYEGPERALAAHDGHQERIWEQPRPFAAADVLLVSDEYKPESVGWRMKQQEIQEPRKTPFRR